LTIYLPEELAKRLQVAATAQSRNAADLVLDVLDRYLPRKTEETKKGKIPYA